MLRLLADIAIRRNFIACDGLKVFLIKMIITQALDIVMRRIHFRVR